jgi:hypothetical protein
MRVKWSVEHEEEQYFKSQWKVEQLLQRLFLHQKMKKKQVSTKNSKEQSNDNYGENIRCITKEGSIAKECELQGL